MFSKDDWQVIDNIIDLAFEEDIRDGDATTNALFRPEEQSSAFMRVKDNGILCGIGVAERVFRRLDKGIAWKPLFQDGDAVSDGQIILEIKGSRRAILTGERLALNLMQRLSGIASMSDRYVKARGDLPVQILDTRKTLPGLRILEKYAVAIGGGTNHRYGLFDAIMIKDNHIKLAGGIRAAVNKVRENNPKKLTVEVETSSLAEVDEALEMNVDIIMLDNMSTEMMREAVQTIAGRSKVEASGGVTIERIREIAETGVDCISVGALTHSVQALDIGLYFRDI